MPRDVNPRRPAQSVSFGILEIRNLETRLQEVADFKRNCHNCFLRFLFPRLPINIDNAAAPEPNNITADSSNATNTENDAVTGNSCNDKARISITDQFC